MSDSPNHNDCFIFETSDAAAGGGDALIVVIFLDVSGSMGGAMENMKNAILHLMGQRVNIRIVVVPFGFKVPKDTVRRGGKKAFWTNDADVNDNCFADGYTYTDNILTLANEEIPKPNAIIVVSDGAFSDSNFMIHLRSLARQGCLECLSHLFVFFPKHTDRPTFDKMKELWVHFVRVEDKVACAPPVFIYQQWSDRHMNNKDYFFTLIEPLIGSVKNIQMPPEWGKKGLLVAGFIAINTNQPASVIANLLPPEVLTRIFDEIRKVITDRPEAIVNPDSNWGFVHRILILSLISPLYRAWFDKFKKECKDSEVKELLNQMKGESFKDDGAVMKKLNALRDNGQCTQFSLYSSTTEITDGKILAGIQSKKCGVLVKTLLNSGVSLRKTETLGKELAMPIVKPKDHRSCLTGLSLLFIQWGSGFSINKELLTVVIFDIAAYFILNPEAAGKLAPFFDMVMCAICNEKWMADELGYNQDLGDFDLAKKPLLFTRFNIRNISIVLLKLKEQIFRSSYSDCEGLKIDPDVINHMVEKFRKLVFYQDIAEIINSMPLPKVKRTYREAIIEGDAIPPGVVIGTLDTSLKEKMVVIWPEKSYTGDREDPKPNLPTIGVVISLICQTNRRGRIIVRVKIEQIDDMALGGTDDVSYTKQEKDIWKLGLCCLAQDVSPETLALVNSFLLALQGEEKHELILHDYKDEAIAAAELFFEKNKCGPKDFVCGSVKRGDLRDMVTARVKEILSTSNRETKYQNVTYEIDVKRDVFNSVFSHYPAAVKEIINSGANMNMSQALEAVRDNSRKERELLPFMFKEHVVNISPAECEQFCAEVIAKISHARKAEIKILEVATCCLCLEPDNLQPHEGHRFKCCSNQVCTECIEPFLEKEYLRGSLLEQSMLACPYCRHALPVKDEKVAAFLTEHQNSTQILVDKACRVCEDCGNIFIQNNPTCGNGDNIAEATSPVCERCEANRDVELVAQEVASSAAGAGIQMWKCPHCDLEGTHGGGCDDMSCVRCGKHSCFKCCMPFNERQTRIIAGNLYWACLHDCTPEAIDAFLHEDGHEESDDENW